MPGTTSSTQPSKSCRRCARVAAVRAVTGPARNAATERKRATGGLAAVAISVPWPKKSSASKKCTAQQRPTAQRPGGLHERVQVLGRRLALAVLEQAQPPRPGNT
eukprot:8157287-Lingulodinium_polyedra.AAC.1